MRIAENCSWKVSQSGQAATASDTESGTSSRASTSSRGMKKRTKVDTSSSSSIATRGRSAGPTVRKRLSSDGELATFKKRARKRPKSKLLGI